MAETKKRLYKRETVKKHLEGFLERAKCMQTGTAPLPYPDKIDEIIVFGSFVNTDNPQIHDLDIYISISENRELWSDFAQNYLLDKRIYQKDFITWMFATYYDEIAYLKGSSHIISIHTHGDREAAFSDKHLVLMKNGKFIEENMKL